VLEVMRRDDRRAWRLGEDARWRRVESSLNGEFHVDTFEALMADAASGARGTGTGA
jgi:hypothetical protein